MAATDTKAEAIAAYQAALIQAAQTNTGDLLAERAIWRHQGFTYIDEDEVMEKLDHEAIKEVIWDATKTHAIVVTGADREACPLLRKRLASIVLDKHPAYGTDEWYAEDERFRTGWLLAERKCWKLVDAKYGATMQRWTRERLGDGHVFIKTEDSVYLTTDAKFIKQDLFTKDTDKLEKLAASLGEQRALFGRQNKALQQGAEASLKALGTRLGEKARAAYTLKSKNGSEADSDE